MSQKSKWPLILVFALLNLLIFIPGVLLSGDFGSWLPVLGSSNHWQALEPFLAVFLRRDTIDPWRISLDLVIISAIWWLPGPWQGFRRHSKILASFYIGLLVYELYSHGVSYFTGKQELIAEDISYIKNIWHFLQSLQLNYQFIYLLLIFIGLVGFFMLIKRIFQLLAHYEISGNSRKAFCALALLTTYSSFCLIWYGAENRRSVVHVTSLKVLSNLERSWTYLQNRAFAQTPLATYPTQQSFAITPNIYLFIIESYGQILIDHPSLKYKFQSLMEDTEHRLLDSGFHIRSGLSLAPVYGGRSWLSQAAIYSGQMVSQQWQYQQLLQDGLASKNLASFLGAAGYHTVGLYPGNRRQINVLGEQNVYQKQRIFSFDDLEYSGPSHNWGQVPDQYSLNFVWETYLRQVQQQQAIFFTFLTISSHAPWNPIPPFLGNWRDLNQPASIQSESRPNIKQKVLDHLHMNWFAGGENQQMHAHFFTSIVYEWSVLEDFMVSHAKQNDIFLLIGDHQPFIAQQSPSNDATLIHLISKDSELLHNFAPKDMLNKLMPSNELTMQHSDVQNILIDGLHRINHLNQRYSTVSAVHESQ